MRTRHKHAGHFGRATGCAILRCGGLQDALKAELGYAKVPFAPPARRSQSPLGGFAQQILHLRNLGFLGADYLVAQAL